MKKQSARFPTSLHSCSLNLNTAGELLEESTESQTSFHIAIN